MTLFLLVRNRLWHEIVCIYLEEINFSQPKFSQYQALLLPHKWEPFSDWLRSCSQILHVLFLKVWNKVSFSGPRSEKGYPESHILVWKREQVWRNAPNSHTMYVTQKLLHHHWHNYLTIQYNQLYISQYSLLSKYHAWQIRNQFSRNPSDKQNNDTFFYFRRQKAAVHTSLCPHELDLEGGSVDRLKWILSPLFLSCKSTIIRIIYLLILTR